MNRVKEQELELTELPIEEVSLLRFVKTPFLVLASCEDFEDDRYEQVVLKILKEIT